uniref:Uncharacterized protein AlNc14C365G11053 n=1 Tax=Albugo laibachii Nc14 TaxID=890382 RepID=F0WXW8_9STRA|nr:conserved hypothetical protein [Albugo laibachii Nc14]|eukprot:CCA26316.1 conserved hypothetical protein [Albugo laibachii Nc14]
MNSQRQNNLIQAAELVAFAIDFEINVNNLNSGGRDGRGGRSTRTQGRRSSSDERRYQGSRGSKYVTRVGTAETRTFYGCGEKGHSKSNCHRNKYAGAAASARVTLAVGTGTCADSNSWILDSGSSVHLVKDVKMFRNATDCSQMFRAANNTMVQVTKLGTVKLRVKVDGREITVDLKQVYYASNLSDNIISCGILEGRGVFLERRNNRNSVVRQADPMKIFEVFRRNNVLQFDVIGSKTSVQVRIIPICGVSNAIPDESTNTSLFLLHQRVGLLAYDIVERMADAKGSGIRLTDRTRPNCLVCAKGKQSKNNQSKKDTGQNAPIDKIGGVIGSDIKGPMTPQDRRVNQYMVNFADYTTNYVRIFAAKNKVQSNKKFEHFLVLIKKWFNCRIHVLRTDGGREYINVDPFCKVRGVGRQISEADNQASNGKAERMHRTVLNMVRCMLFASGLPIHSGATPWNTPLTC